MSNVNMLQTKAKELNVQSEFQAILEDAMKRDHLTLDEVNRELGILLESHSLEDILNEVSDTYGI